MHALLSSVRRDAPTRQLYETSRLLADLSLSVEKTHKSVRSYVHHRSKLDLTDEAEAQDLRMFQVSPHPPWSFLA